MAPHLPPWGQQVAWDGGSGCDRGSAAHHPGIRPVPGNPTALRHPIDGRWGGHQPLTFVMRDDLLRGPAALFGDGHRARLHVHRQGCPLRLAHFYLQTGTRFPGWLTPALPEQRHRDPPSCPLPSPRSSARRGAWRLAGGLQPRWAAPGCASTLSPAATSAPAGETGTGLGALG